MSGTNATQIFSPTKQMISDQPSTLMLADGATARSSRRITIAGLSIIAILFGVFGVWAAFASLASGVVAQGIVMAEGNRSTVQHLQGGIVKEILVEEGDSVTVGQVLLRLDDVQIRAKLGSLQAEYDASRGREARFLAEQTGQPNIVFPDDLLDRMDTQRVNEIVAGEAKLFEERRAALDASIQMISQRRSLYERHISGSEAQIESRKIQLAIIKDELVGLEQLFANGYVAKTRLLKLKREVAQLEGDVGQKESEVAQANIKIIEVQVEENQTRADFRKEVTTSLREVRGQLNDLEEQILAAKDTLQRLDIRAPRNGTVLDLQFHAKNAVIMPGSPVLDIVPIGDALIIDAKINPTDIDNVIAGAQAEVRFPAFRQRTTPSVFGTVTTVSADTLVDPGTNSAYYTARVVVDEVERRLMGDRALVPGMPADVTVQSGERTLIEYLIEPLSDVLARSFKE